MCIFIMKKGIFIKTQSNIQTKTPHRGLPSVFCKPVTSRKNTFIRNNEFKEIKLMFDMQSIINTNTNKENLVLFKKMIYMMKKNLDKINNKTI